MGNVIGHSRNESRLGKFAHKAPLIRPVTVITIYQPNGLFLIADG